jgi:F-type H+-transporting ATPase subunit c
MKKLFSLMSAFGMTLLSIGVAMAAEGATGAAGDSTKAAAIALALGQGRVGAAAMESIGRNPNAADRLFLPLVLSLALLEALALYGFVIAIILTGKI